jgi:hypothetical protein
MLTSQIAAARIIATLTTIRHMRFPPKHGNLISTNQSNKRLRGAALIGFADGVAFAHH